MFKQFLLPRLVKRLTILGVVCASLCVTPISYAQVGERTIQAAWINQLVQYIRWRDRDYKSLTICTLGSDAVGKYLKEINQRPNITIKIRPDEEEYKSCHFLYISDSEEAHVEQILLSIRNEPILTLSSIKGFARLGGMIQFVLEKGGTVSLRINKSSAAQSNIIIDSDLLSISDVISND